MNIRIVLAALALLSSTAIVHADEQCSQASLNGKYAGWGHSQFTNPAFDPSDIAANVTMSEFDGHGHSSGSELFNVAQGSLVATATSTGTYTMNADCTFQETGTVVIHLLSGPISVPYTNLGVISDHGRHIAQMAGTTNAPGTMPSTSGLATGTLEKLDVTWCTRVPEGRYALNGLILGLIDDGFEIGETLVGSVTIDDEGNASGTVINNKGPSTGTSSLTASFVMHHDCTFTWTNQDGELFSGVALIKPDRVELHAVKANPPTTDPNTGAVVTDGTAVFTLVSTR